MSLEKAGLTWGNYGGYAFHDITDLKGKKKHTSSKFKSDAASGNLPNVSWVFAPEGKGLSEHPPENVTDGMNWTVEQINAVVQGVLWSNSAIFITWDDWEGWFDHVDPPNVESWNDDGTHPSYDNTQFRYGSRVGCIVLHSTKPICKERIHIKSITFTCKSCQILRNKFWINSIKSTRCKCRRHV